MKIISITLNKKKYFRNINMIKTHWRVYNATEIFYSIVCTITNSLQATLLSEMI